MKTVLSFLASLVLFALVSLPARAASIDVSPLVDFGFQLANAVLVPLVAAGVLLLLKKLKFDGILADAAANKMLHDGIQRGIDALEGAGRDRVFRNGGVTVDVSSEAVATVSNRMIELSPQLLKRLGVTEEMLKKLVAEKLFAAAA